MDHFDLKLLDESLHLVNCKYCSLIGCEGLENAKAVYNTFLDKFDYLLLGRFSHRNYFCLLSKIICGHKDKSMTL
jgi:hypothetical protein